jgi:tetratricopeptide (TPR) repeat protein
VQAEKWLTLARDLDPTPIRANTMLRQSIHEIATQTGVPLADPAAVFKELAFSGEVGLILDYAHPTALGHVEFARVVSSSFPARFKGWDTVEAVAFDARERLRAKTVEPTMNVDVSYAWARIFDQKGQLDRAADMYRRSIELGNTSPEARYLLATNLLQQGDLPEALQWAVQLNRETPGFVPAFGLLATLFERTGAIREAMIWYRKALEAGVEDEDLLMSAVRLLLQHGEIAGARQLLDSSSGVSECRLASLFGEVLEREGAFPAAEQRYRTQLNHDPGCHAAWENLGLLLMNRGDWQGAEGIFREALEQPSSWPFHHLNLGIIYSQGLNMPDRAAQEFRNFVALQPDQVDLVPSSFRASLLGIKGKL